MGDFLIAVKGKSEFCHQKKFRKPLIVAEARRLFKKSATKFDLSYNILCVKI